MRGTDETAAGAASPVTDDDPFRRSTEAVTVPRARLVRPGMGAVPVGGEVAGLTTTDSAVLKAFIDAHRRLLVLTGAGISTAAGIPDYRDDGGRWKGAAPMSWQAFTGSPLARRRYWARSVAGWPRMAAASPTIAHRALARLEADGRCGLLVTQNVDGLHQRAGSRAVIDLHGRLDRVVCLDCGGLESRAGFQQRMIDANPAWPWLPGAGVSGPTAPRPDGDAELDSIDEIDYAAFEVPSCRLCGGTLKPDVVFFGDSVPRDRVARALAALDDSDAVLIVGSSLTVFSGWRFARDAAARGLPIAAINRGATRADPLLALKIIVDADVALGPFAGPTSDAEPATHSRELAQPPGQN